MTLLLVRHAESSGNSDGRIQGWTDTVLTPAGEAQATALARRLASQPIDAVYASPLLRAYATAQAVAAAAGLQVVPLDGLRERYYGRAQGMTWTGAAARWPGRVRHDADWAEFVPEVEPLQALRDRAVRAVEDVLDRHQDGVAVCVSHGGTIAQVIGHLLALPIDVWPRIRVANTSVTVIEGASRAPLVRTLNDICHLDEDQRRTTLAL